MSADDPNSPTVLAELMARLSAHSPEMRQKIEQMSGYTGASSVRDRIKAFVNELMDDPNISTSGDIQTLRRMNDEAKSR